jgi:hypothetical protein
MAVLNVQKGSNTGTSVVYQTAAAGGDLIPNNGKTILLIRNGHATLPRTVTIPTPATHRGLAVADLSVAVPAQGHRLMGPFEQGLFDNEAGQVQMTYTDSGADLTFGVFTT